MDPFVFDLHNGIALIEEYGMGLENLLWLDKGTGWKHVVHSSLII